MPWSYSILVNFGVRTDTSLMTISFCKRILFCSSSQTLLNWRCRAALNEQIDNLQERVACLEAGDRPSSPEYTEKRPVFTQVGNNTTALLSITGLRCSMMSDLEHESRRTEGSWNADIVSFCSANLSQFLPQLL